MFLTGPESLNTTMTRGQQWCRSPWVPQTEHLEFPQEEIFQTTIPWPGDQGCGLQHYSPFGNYAHSCEIDRRLLDVWLWEILVGSRCCECTAVEPFDEYLQCLGSPAFLQVCTSAQWHWRGLQVWTSCGNNQGCNSSSSTMACSFH